MRFLLHPTIQRVSTVGRRVSKVAARRLPRGSGSIMTPKVLTSKICDTGSSEDDTAVRIQAWGQQCSPNCGCVVRFEATIDPTTNQFTSASYHAKAVVVTRTCLHQEDSGGGVSNSSTLEPVLTLRTGKPMFQKCTCESLHKLATEITNYIPRQPVLSFQSKLDFTGLRSSPAFRHTVLEKQGLPSSDTHCFDVVEEALTAMVKGYMLKPRPQTSVKDIYANISESKPAEEEQRGNQDRYHENFRIDMSHILATPRAMSALRMFDFNAQYSPFDRTSSASEPGFGGAFGSTGKKKKDGSAGKPSKTYDWVSYVDELYERRQDIERSA